ncbi:TPA: hypothetical protein HH293_17825 [Xanthomonas vasicola pv. zeae]|nr:hypothetical protein [Xanthomonas vasicola pv. zeae]
MALPIFGVGFGCWEQTLLALGARAGARKPRANSSGWIGIFLKLKFAFTLVE